MTVITTRSIVYHLETDLTDPQKILFSDNSELRMTDKNTTSTLVGLADNLTYAEGVGTSALFNGITGFLQLNTTAVVVADRSNHCLRWVDRLTLSTSPFVGHCQMSGFVDGERALFKWPHSIIKDVRSADKLFATDFGNSALRNINVFTKITTTVIHPSSGLSLAEGLAFDFHNANLIISNRHYVSKYNLVSQSLTNLTNITGWGYAGPSFSVAKFNYPSGLVTLTENLILVADDDNRRVRVLNLAEQTISSICSGSNGSLDGSTNHCQLRQPHSFLVTDDMIYIGQEKAIRAMPYCKFFIKTFGAPNSIIALKTKCHN